MTTKDGVDVVARQDPLREHYKKVPEAAAITDRARTSSGVENDPFHGQVTPGTKDYGTTLRFGIHSAIGGYHDAPNPGDLLCGALAACLDSTLRIIGERLRVKFTALEVDVTADLDVRGTLAVDRHVPVGFQTLHCHVRLRTADDTAPELAQKLVTAAEAHCVVLQTLLAGTVVETTLDLDGSERRHQPARWQPELTSKTEGGHR
jgi:uncharacterized OsmC-like protein